MSTFPFLRRRVRRLAITSICSLFVAVALMWANRQQAATSDGRVVVDLSSPGALAAEIDSIRPNTTTIVVNSLLDVANANDGICTLREAIMAANNNIASGTVAGECAAGTAT